MSALNNRESAREGLTSRRVLILLMLILFGGMLLRLQNAAGKDFFYDEVFTLDVARLPIPQMMRDLAHDTSPPLYFMLLKGWIFLSESYANVKSLPPLIGLFGVVSAYFFGAALFGRPVGLLTALLLALSPFHVRFSQELRMYTLYPAFLALAGACLMQALHSRRKGYWLLFSSFNALALYTHYHAFFFIVAAYVFLLVRMTRKPDRQEVTWSARSFYILLGLSIPLVPLLMGQIAYSLGKVSWVPTPSLLDLPRTYCIGFMYYFEALPERAWMWILSIALFLALILFHARKQQDSAASGSVLFLLCTAFLPIFVMFVLSYSVVKFFYVYRYVIISLTPFLALLAYGLYSVRWKALRAALLAAFIIIGIVFTVIQNERNYKPHWRALASVIDSRVQPGDILIGNPVFYMNGYYLYSTKDHPILGFREVMRNPYFNPREFYFLQFNAELPEDTLFPHLLRDVFRQMSVVQDVYSDWWFTLSRHTQADFPALRRWYFNRRRIGKEQLPVRTFAYFVDAADERLEGAPGFAPLQIDEKWEPYRWTFGTKVSLPLPGTLSPGSYRLWMKCNLEYPEEIKDYQLSISLDGQILYDTSGARGEQLISSAFQFHPPATSRKKTSPYPIVQFSTTTWVPKNWKKSEDERPLAFHFYWLGIEHLTGEESKSTLEPEKRQVEGKP